MQGTDDYDREKLFGIKDTYFSVEKSAIKIELYQF